MKSDARPAPQRNDPAEGLTGLSGLWTRHGNKVLIVVAVAFLVLAAVRYRRAQAAEKLQQSHQALAEAWSGVQQLPQLAAAPASAEIDKLRSGLESQINQAVERVVANDAATPTQAAWAWLARGELYWAMAHASGAAATTQPATGPASQPAPRSPSETLDLAAKAYGQVVTGYLAVAEPAKLARFSLAAIAEEKRDLAAARQQYKALIETDGIGNADKSMATSRLSRLDSLDKPLLLLPASQPAVTAQSTDELIKGLGLPLTLGVGPMPATRPAATAPSR